MSNWPTEDMATKALEAAARKLYNDQASEDPGSPSYDELSPVSKNEIKVALLPAVWAALEALPDPRHVAWTEGHAAGYGDGGFDAAGSGPYEYAENPYPSGL